MIDEETEARNAEMCKIVGFNAWQICVTPVWSHTTCSISHSVLPILALLGRVS